MPQAKTLSKAELKQVLEVTRSCSRYPERDATMLLFTHWCGMRVGEVAALMISDVVDEAGKIKAELVLDAARTKSKRARRVFLPKQMQRQLVEYLSTRGDSASDFLFLTQKRQGFSANTATQHLKQLYARAGIAGATSHSGRRTWITNLSQKGVGVRVLAEMAGHASIQTTQRYIDVNDEMMRAAAELI